MGKLLKYFLLATWIVVSVHGSIEQSVSDPCSFQTNQVFDADEILKCYNSIPADAKRMESTLASLHQLIQAYSFTDIAMSNIAPYNINVDLAAELNQIGQTSWTQDYAFHIALSRLFNKLNDAHTVYYAPSPYLDCFVIKGFALVPSPDAASTEDVPINLVVNKLARLKWTWPIDLSQYSGLQVMQINGQEPRDYLMTYADRVGLYKDKIVRFNHLFDLVGWSVIDPYTSPISDIPNEVVTVFTADGKYVNVTVPVKMFCPELSFNNTDDFIKRIDTPETPSDNSKRTISMFDSAPDLRKERLRRIEELVKPTRNVRVDTEMDSLDGVERFALAMRRLKARGAEGVDSLELVMAPKDNSTLLFAMLDKNGNYVPVLKVVSFAPEMSSINTWIRTLFEYGKVLRRYNFTYGIVDVNKNGGGIICLTQLLQGMMDERIASVAVNRTDVLWTPYNLRKSKLFDAIYQGVQNMDGNYLDTQTGESIDPKDFYNNETHSVILPNNIKPELTQFAYLPGFCKVINDFYLGLVTAWPKELIITTDGTCGSACAAFVAKMTQLGRAKIVATGGDTKYTNTTMRTASFIGGNVVEWSDMNMYTNLTTPFTTSAKARFNWHQTFSSISYDQYPLEYNYTAFEPTDVLRSWKMVVNDDPSTDEGFANLAETYGAVVSLWGDYHQTLPTDEPMAVPISRPPITSPSPNIPPVGSPSISPVASVPSTSPVAQSTPAINSPSSSTNGPDTNSSTAALWVVIVMAIVAVVALIAAGVFGIKYAQMKKLVGEEGVQRLLPISN